MDETTALAQKKTYQRNADLALVLVALVWGGGFLAGDIAMEGFHPVFILTIRFLGSSLIMLPLFWKRIRTLDRYTVRCGVCVGVLQAVSMLIQLVGLSYTSPGKQAFLVATYPIFVPFLSWFITRRKPGLKVLLAAVLMIVGIGLLSLNESLSIGLGDSLSLLFSVLFALQFVLVGIFAATLDTVQLSFVQFLSAGIFSLIATAFTGQWPQAGFSSGPALAVLYLVVVNLLFAVQNTAQKYTSDARASILTSLECLFGFLLSVFLMHEPVTLKILLGCVFIFAAVLISNLAKHQAPAK